MKKHLLLLALSALSFSSFAVTPQGAEVAKELAVNTSHFTLAKKSTISYGVVGSTFIDKDLDAGTYVCYGPTFGVAHQVTKPRAVCKYTVAGGGIFVPPPVVVPSPTVSWGKIAFEGERFELKEARRVRFGLEVNGKDQFVAKVLPANRYICDNGTFGSDPASGVTKRCDFSNEMGLTPEAAPATPLPETPVVTAPVVTPTPTPTPTPVASSPISTPEGYRAVAATFGYKEGLTYRYGSAPSIFSDKSWDGNRFVRSYISLAGDSAVKQADGVVANRGCSKNGYCGVYNIGENLRGQADDYSSTIGNFAFIPVKPVPDGIVNKTYLGFGSAEVLNMGHNTMSTIIQPSWTTYINKELDNTLNDENIARYAGLQSGYDRTKFDMKICPVASTRGYGRGGWTTNAVGLNCDGEIFGYGSNTAHNFFHEKVVPDGMTPTGLTISNSGEFAFVTAWDTKNIKGKVFVVAMSDACQWCAGEPLDKWYGNWGNHRREYPGLPGLGNYSGAKVIGVIDLPDNMTAPTDVAVTTGKPKNGDGYQRTQSFWVDNLLSEGNRKRFYDGDWVNSIPRSGLLMVASKSEKLVALYDLRPLLMYYRQQYFTKSQGDFDAMINGMGKAPNQWPFSFDVAPQQKPQLVKLQSFNDEVTSIQLTRNAPHRALIGTMEGAFRVFDLGTGYLDQMANATGKPEDIKQIFAMDVGANPTSIAFKKEIPDWDGTFLYGKGQKTPEQFFWVASRATNTATFLEFNNEMTSATKKLVLQDKRIRGMVKVEDADNHGTESYVLSVVDMEGMGIHNFMYGPITMRTAKQDVTPCPINNPCKLKDGQPFEYVNTLRIPGIPFNMSSSNIN